MGWKERVRGLLQEPEPPKAGSGRWLVHVKQREEGKLITRCERWSVTFYDVESTFTSVLSAVVGGPAWYGKQISWKRKETERRRQR